MATNSPIRGRDVRRDSQAALLEVAHRTQARFSAATGVGATLMVSDAPLFVAVNAYTKAIDTVQYGLGEGPCLTAVENSDVVWSGSIGAGEARWPRFTARTVELGLGSVLSAPILSDGETIGSLNLYARQHRTFGEDVVSIRRVAASEASELGGLHLLALAEAASVEAALALHNRRDVDVAVGILTDRYLLTLRQARVLLTQLAHQDGVDDVTAARRLIGGDVR